MSPEPRRKRIPYHANSLRKDALTESKKIQRLMGEDILELLDDLDEAIAENNLRWVELITMAIRQKLENAVDKAKLIESKLEQMTNGGNDEE